jgi:hypothetical protein
MRRQVSVFIHFSALAQMVTTLPANVARAFGRSVLVE